MSLATLRAETVTIHSRLEKKLNLFERVKSKEDYQKHLQNYYAWIAPIERALLSFAEALPIDLSGRQRANLLEKDLAKLGSPPIEIQKKFKMQSPQNIADCMGALYTLEGSTLGGQFIFKHFAEHLNLTKDNGLAFYYGRGARTGQLWKEFLQALDQYMTDHPNQIEDICNSAKLTFEDAETALCT